MIERNGNLAAQRRDRSPIMPTVNKVTTEVAITNARFITAALYSARQIGAPMDTRQKANTHGATFQGGHAVNFELRRFGAAMSMA
jgi:hypothetical protein